MDRDEIASMGGKARAASMTPEARLAVSIKGNAARKASMTPEARRASAQLAARSRWMLKATHGSSDRPLRIGATEIPCFVLENGKRVIVLKGMLTALGMSFGGAGGGEPGSDRLSSFMGSNSIKPFVSKDLSDRIHPIEFLPPHNGRPARGYEATLLAEVCDVVLEARKVGKLAPNQQHIAEQAESLVRSFAKIGIIALIDEATGYQESRDKSALQALLDRYLRQELAAWAKRFPDEFYKQIFRLRGWEWRGMSVNRPQVVAHYTKDIVYARLAPGILEELEARAPRNKTGKKTAALHSWLVEDVGVPALAQHLWAVIGLMRATDGWDEFMRLLDRSFPKQVDALKRASMLEPKTEA